MGNIYKIENHDEALKIWRRKEIQNAVVIHVDSHIDFTDPDECFYITIANYLNYAYDEGIISSLIWVIPDESFSDSSIMDDIVKEISSFFRFTKKNKHKFCFELIENKDFIMYITTLFNLDLEKIKVDRRALLLDIDCDYYMNPKIQYTYSYCFPDNCWMKRDIFCKAIYDIYKESKVITISRSVVGGYTPLLFCYLDAQIDDMLTKGVNSYSQIEKAIEIMSLNPKRALNIYLKDSEFMHGESEIYRFAGIIYCYMLQENYKEGEKWYKKLFDSNKQYERYFLPVHGLLQEGKYSVAEELTEKWLKIAPFSQNAICYKIRIMLQKENINSDHLEKMFDKLTDEDTCYEKSYLYMLFAMKTKRYDQAIQFGFQTINFLLNNDTPEWVNQISSYENNKTHGIIIAKIYKYISIIYLKLRKEDEALKYARISRLMGF